MVRWTRGTPVGLAAPLRGSTTSAVSVGKEDSPPLTRMRPSRSSTAVWPERPAASEPMRWNVPKAGS